MGLLMDTLSKASGKKKPKNMKHEVEKTLFG